MVSIKKILDLLTPNEKKRAYLLLAMILLMAFLDVVGVASIMPFMAVLGNAQLIEMNPVLSYIYKAYGFKNSQEFLFALGVMVFLLLVVSLVFKALTIYAQTRFALMREFSIGQRVVESYLHQPYSWFLNRHSADLGKTVLSEVSNLIHGGLLPMMALLAQSAVALALLLLLLLVDPLLAVSVVVVLGSAYGVVFKLMSGWLKRLGEKRAWANQQRYIAVSEVFGAAKEVKVGGLEQIYTQRFAKPAEIYADAQSTAQIITQLPRFILEGIAFGGMLLVVLYLVASSGGFGNALPVIALYAFAGYRLMPALQQIYAALTQLRFAAPALEALHSDLKSLAEYQTQHRLIHPLQFKNHIVLDGVTYSYPNTQQPALNDINLVIPVNSTIGIVGSTGSGKTTIVDLILGLLEAQKGDFRVDDQLITASNRRMWQKNIGYVPQQIYLADDTVTANIAFGVPADKIDQAAVERAAEIANLHSFVINDLPLGYKTSVGERGVRLSGGQRQRIGIARALYHQPQVLILDEATSALDNLTEQAVMEAVHNLDHGITIILIAHRLSTVRDCDIIFRMEKGQIKAQGTFSELIQTDEHFRALSATIN